MFSTLLALTLAASATTKLGVFVVGDDATSQALLAACPPAIVVPLSTTSTIPTTQITAFRNACPRSVVVAQVGGTGMNITFGAADADAGWSTWFTLLGTLGFTNFDAVEGPSEPYGDFNVLASFWAKFSDHVDQIIPNGKLPVVGSLMSGTMGTAFCPTATTMKARGKTWAWSYHGFSASLTQSVATETALFWYRGLKSGCGLAGVPFYMTKLAPGAGRNWQSGDVTWLAWVDGQLAQDPEVVTAALFAAGGSTQPLTPIAPDLAAYFQNPNPTPADGGVPDGGADGGSDGGGQNGVVPPEGGIIPSGPAPQSTGCATAGAGFGLLTVIPLLLARRRTRRQRSARDESAPTPTA